MKTKILIIVTLIISLSFVVCSRSPSDTKEIESIPYSIIQTKPDDPTVFLEISESSTDKQVVEVHVNSAVPVVAYDFYFHFDPDIWEGEKASHGSFLQVEGAEFMPLDPEIKNDAGSVFSPKIGQKISSSGTP